MAVNFSAYDMALLYNCKLLKESIESLGRCNFDNSEEICSLLEPVLKKPGMLKKLVFQNFESFGNVAKSGACFSLGASGKHVFYGYFPQLLAPDFVDKKCHIENFLFGVAVPEKLIDFNKLNDDDFCIDSSGMVYFPLVNKTLSKSGEDFVPCASSSVNWEQNLDICHSLIALKKLWDLISASCTEIISRLNEIFAGKCVFKADDVCSFFSGVKCGFFIKADDLENCLYYGLNPNVFEDSLEKPKSAIVGDYFSGVGIYKDFVSNESNSNLIKNGALFDDGWCYFPICRKLLCCDNFYELYIERVVNIIKEGFKI